MRFIKQIFLWAVIIGSFSYAYFLWNRGPCYEPIEYSVVSFSDRFGISKPEFAKAISEAEAIWEKKAGKELFSLAPADENGDLAVNLLYDQRQATADKNETLESKVGEVTSQADIVGARFDALKRDYEALNSKYGSDVLAYQKSLREFNASVDSWNKKGGAPEGEYDKLQAESVRLSALQASLEKERLEVNDMVARLNGLAAEYNGLIKAANSNIDVINQSADKEFEQGEFISDKSGRRINIYEFKDRAELVRVLAHELGHALGIDHNKDPESIMYYLNSGTSMQLSKEDMDSLIGVCRLEISS